MKNLNFVELFAGAGGLSEGFVRQGYIPTAFVEQDYYCCQTLKTRLIYHELEKKGKIEYYHRYLSGSVSYEELCKSIDGKLLDKVIRKKISKDSIKEILSKINILSEEKPIDILLGGAPCQAYSLIGRAQNKHKKDDERLYLYKHYLKLLSELKPKYFVFENVPGLLSINQGELFKNMLLDFQKLNYKVSYQVLDASEYGVLQARKRVIVVGSLKTKVSFESSQLKGKFKVFDLLNDLAPLQAGDKKNKYTNKPNLYLKETNIRKEDDILTWHETRTHNSRDKKIYQQIVSTWNNQKKRLRYHQIDENLKTHKNQKSFLDRFKVVAGDLSVSHTMVAHIAKDGHHYIHPDKKQNRSLSVREAARIQSFPDNYFFEGPRTAAFTQIGNAVPPLLSQEIARQLVNK